MSGPGGPASTATTMTPPSGMGAAQNMSRIKSNIQKMIDQSAPEADIDAYLSHEGVTVDQLKNSPVAAPYQKDQTSVSAYNPNMTQRAKDLLKARQAGVRPQPLLDSQTSPFVRAMDWVNNLGRASDVAAHGFTGGLSDEAAGLGSGAAAALSGQPVIPAFKQGMDATNANNANFHEDYPVAGAALEAAGLLASPLMRLGSGWQQAAATATGRAVRAAGVGFGQGAAAGAAYNEGGPGDRLEAALFGGAIGAPLAGVVAPVAETATRGVQTFMDALNARRAAANDPAARARAMLAAAIARDGVTPIPQQGEALVSAGGPNVQSLGRQATVAPGNARAVAADYFGSSAADRPDAIGQAVQRNISGDRLLPNLEALDRQQRAASGPAYDAFYAMSPDAFDTPFFRNLMGGSVGKGLIGDAYKLGEIDKAAGHATDNPMQYLLDSEGNVSLNQAPTPRAVDLMKRALDQKVAENTNQVTGKVIGAQGGSWNRLLQTFKANADQASTVNGQSLYANARAAYAGPQGLKDAANMGAQALKGAQLTSEKAQAFNDLSPAEQQAFRTGLAEAVIDKAGGMGPATDPLQLFLKGRNANQLMRLYMGSQDAFDDFAHTLQQQSRIVKAGNTVMGGSPTGPRIAEGADAAAQEAALTNQLTMARDAWNLATGRGGGRVSAAVNLTNRARNAATGVSEPTANELGRLLFNPDQTLNMDTVRSLGAMVPQQQLQATRQALLQRLAGSSAGRLPAAPIGAFIGSH